MDTPRETQYRMWEPGGTESKDTSGGGLGTPPYGGPLGIREGGQQLQRKAQSLGMGTSPDFAASC